MHTCDGVPAVVLDLNVLALRQAEGGGVCHLPGVQLARGAQHRLQTLAQLQQRAPGRQLQDPAQTVDTISTQYLKILNSISPGGVDGPELQLRHLLLGQQQVHHLLGLGHGLLAGGEQGPAALLLGVHLHSCVSGEPLDIEAAGAQELPSFMCRDLALQTYNNYYIYH